MIGQCTCMCEQVLEMLMRCRSCLRYGVCWHGAFILEKSGRLHRMTGVLLWVFVLFMLLRHEFADEMYLHSTRNYPGAENYNDETMSLVPEVFTKPSCVVLTRL